MRQFNTPSAHNMNHNDQFVNFRKHQQTKTEYQNRTFPTCYRQGCRAQQNCKWYKKRNPLFFTVQKLAQYSLTSVAVSFRLVAFSKPSIDRPMSRKPWEKKKTNGDRETETWKQCYSHYSSSEQGLWWPNVKFEWQSTQEPSSVMHYVGT